MTPARLHRALLAYVLVVAGACAHPRVYQRAVPLGPALDTTAASWERHAVGLLEARGYEVTANDDPAHSIHAERLRGDSARDVVRARRAIQDFAAGPYLYRYAYEIDASSTGAAGQQTNLGPELTRDVDSLVAAFEALRAGGVPPWVGRLTCARHQGMERRFYISTRGMAVEMGSQRVREHGDYKGGLTVTADGADGLRIDTWSGSGDEVTALRDAMLQRCGGTVQPRPTEASASG